MAITVKQLAELVQGTVQGNGELLVTTARPLGEAQAGDITFLEHDKHLPQLHASPAAAAVVPASVPLNGKTLIQVADPLMAFVAIVQHLHARPPAPPHGIDPRACVHATAKIGAEPSIYPLAVIGEGTMIGDRCRIHSGAVIGRDCRLGHDVTIHPNVVLYDGTVVGDRAILHANTVIGADGFGYRFKEGRHVKVPQLGRVEIGADVEIGACTAIDRATFGATVIGAGTKIDNLVQIGHNCKIGKHNIFVGQVGIAGSVTTEDYVIMGGQVGVADHLHIGKGAKIAAQSGLMRDVPAGQIYAGSPAMPERDVARHVLLMQQLPDMRKDLKKIKQKLGLTED